MKKVEVISRHAAASFIVFAEYSPPPWEDIHSTILSAIDSALLSV